MGGGKKVDPNALISDKLKRMNEAMMSGETMPSGEEWELEEGASLVQFEMKAIAVLEDVGKVTVKLVRVGNCSGSVIFSPCLPCLG